jgi:hypothetical protein
VSRLRRFEDTSTKDALEMATSPSSMKLVQVMEEPEEIDILPDPIAIPTSLAVSAFDVNQLRKIVDIHNTQHTSASLIPSPTIATTQRSFNLRLNPGNVERFFFGTFS